MEGGEKHMWKLQRALQGIIQNEDPWERDICFLFPTYKIVPSESYMKKKKKNQISKPNLKPTNNFLNYL